MRTRSIVLICILLTAVLGSLVTEAAPPQLINYQGRLIDGTNLVSGQLSVVLRIYTNATMGGCLFEDSNDVTVVDGLYSTQLGAHPVSGTLTAALAGAEAWIEVEVNGVVLSPRERILSAAYSLDADTLDNLDSSAFATSAALTGEQNARISSDAALQAARIGADSSLSGQVSVVSSQLSVETNNRIGADTALSNTTTALNNALTGESAARIGADASLSNQLTTVNGQLTDLETGKVSRAGDTMTGPLTIDVSVYSQLVVNSHGSAIQIGNNAWVGTGDGVAIGRNADGEAAGVAIGTDANGRNFGVGIGVNANGSYESVAIGDNTYAEDEGTAIGYHANAFQHGIALGHSANGFEFGISIGLNSTNTNSGIGIGYRAKASHKGIAIGGSADAAGAYMGGSNRIAIGNSVTNAVDESARLRGTLYLDGGTGVYYRSTFGSGAWANLLDGVATGTPLYAYTETDPIWDADKPNYATTAALGTETADRIGADGSLSGQVSVVSGQLSEETNNRIGADADLSNQLTAVNGQLTAVETGKVSKTGDTMTGQLTISGAALSVSTNRGMVSLISIGGGDDVEIGNGADGYMIGTAVGLGAQASEHGTALGAGAVASNYGSAVGFLANAYFEGAAVGANANAQYWGAAIGENANGANRGAAVGYLANAYYYGVAVGRSTVATNHGTAVGDTAYAHTYGTAVGKDANGSSVGVAVGYSARGADDGVAIGRQSQGAGSNVAVGAYASAGAGGGNRIAIGSWLTNDIDNSAAIRGTLYLDGGTGVYYRSTFGSGPWIDLLASLATGTPLYAYTETDPVWNAQKSAYATGTPLYAETDPVWLAQKSGYATGTPIYAETDPFWTAVSNNVQSQIDGKVSKAGDTMTGALTNQSSVTAARFYNSNNSAAGLEAAALGGIGNAADSDFAFVGGGQANEADGLWAVVGGGVWNQALGHNSAIGGGGSNLVSMNSGTIAGGWDNTVTNSDGFVGGGYLNFAGGSGAVIGGGRQNIAENDQSVVGGGATNMATGAFSTVPGGDQNAAAGRSSLAAGHRAKANHDGSFVLTDAQDADFASADTDTFNARFQNGYYLTGGPIYGDGAGLTNLPEGSETDPFWNADKAGGFTMGGDLDMGNHSITNVKTSTIVFADGSHAVRSSGDTITGGLTVQGSLTLGGEARSSWPADTSSTNLNMGGNGVTNASFLSFATNVSFSTWTGAVPALYYKTNTLVRLMPDSYTKLLLHMDEPNNSTNFVDHSTNGWPVRTFGDARQSTFNPRFGTSCAYFDGVGDYLRVTNKPISADFNFGTNDFTVEFFVIAQNSPCCFFAKGYGSGGVAGYEDGSGTLRFNINSAELTAPFRLINGNWTHLAFTRQAGVAYMFANGQLLATVSMPYDITNGLPFAIGRRDYYSDLHMVGYMDEFRVSVGTARYTANFAPPTAAFNTTGTVAGLYFNDGVAERRVQLIDP